MRLDVLLCTHNRAALLGRTLESLLRAPRPEGLDVRVVVVDNNSRDETADVVRAFAEGPAAASGLAVTYLFEPRPGKSHALNTGLAATDAELIGLIDDDEEVEARWFAAVADAFADPALDYITGPCVPRWEVPPPSWLATEWDPVMGLFHQGDRPLRMPDEYGGQMMGGNAAIRRAVLMSAGGYDASLGPSEGARQLSCEDSEMHERLCRMGARGMYRPDFIIYHLVPAARLTKGYHHRWHFWHGVSLGLLDRRSPEPVAYALGVPRHLLGTAVRDLGVLAGVRRGDGERPPEARRFGARLRLLSLAGFWYGRNRYRPAAGGAAPAGAPAPLASAAR